MTRAGGSNFKMAHANSKPGMALTLDSIFLHVGLATWWYFCYLGFLKAWWLVPPGTVLLLSCLGQSRLHPVWGRMEEIDYLLKEEMIKNL